MWVRALVLCDDVRFELGGTMTLVGVLADRVAVPPHDGTIVLPRLAIYTHVAGLSGATELAWRMSLTAGGGPAGEPIAAGQEVHDGTADEHRLVHIASPLALPGAGRYRLTIELDANGERRLVDHDFTIEV